MSFGCFSAFYGPSSTDSTASLDKGEGLLPRPLSSLALVRVDIGECVKAAGSVGATVHPPLPAANAESDNRPHALPPPAASTRSHQQGSTVHLALPRSQLSTLRDVRGGDEARLTMLTSQMRVKLLGKLADPELVALLAAVAAGKGRSTEGLLGTAVKAAAAEE